MTEIIVVDNNSTDATPKLLAALAEQHDKIVPHHCLEQGASCARNHGLRFARGNWIQFLDADDSLHPDKLKDQLSTITDGTTWLIGAYTNVYPDGTTLQNIPHQDPWKGLVFQYRIGCTHANLYRKDQLTAIGGWDEKLPDNEDPELHFQLLKEGAPWQLHPIPLCAYHHHQQNQLSQHDLKGGSRRRLELLERVNTFLQEHRPDYWKKEGAFFTGATLRALRVYATHDPGAAAGAYDRIFEQGWEHPPALIAPWVLLAYQVLGFYRTESLRLRLRNWLPSALKNYLKAPRI